MSVAIVHSRAVVGVQAPQVCVEVFLSSGIPKFNIVGLPEKAVKESAFRVSSAIRNSGFFLPMKVITVNLAPADLPKSGSCFDLAIALGILAADNQLPIDALAAYEFAGELALNGDLRAIRGALNFAANVPKDKSLILSAASAPTAALASDTSVFAAHNLQQVFRHLIGAEQIAASQPIRRATATANFLDMHDIKGQAHAKRALEIAASGSHSLLLAGPPGTGKTMLAKRLPGILPELRHAEAVQVASLYSLSPQGFDYRNWGQRPFRAPHHTTSHIALVGGGKPPAPGEVSLAHLGVLFLDELPEFKRQALETLRQPLESHEVSIVRAGYHVKFPAQFQLIAAMNPCPCGYYGDRKTMCRCSSERILNYQNKLSGPLLDRIDMRVTMAAVNADVLFAGHEKKIETSDMIRQRVECSRQRQWRRQGCLNNAIANRDLERHCVLSAGDREYLKNLVDQLDISARMLHRLLKVARTIADMAANDVIAREHIVEALSYRLATYSASQNG